MLGRKRHRLQPYSVETLCSASHVFGRPMVVEPGRCLRHICDCLGGQTICASTCLQFALKLAGQLLTLVLTPKAHWLAVGFMWLSPLTYAPPQQESVCSTKALHVANGVEGASNTCWLSAKATHSLELPGACFSSWVHYQPADALYGKFIECAHRPIPFHVADARLLKAPVLQMQRRAFSRTLG